MPRDARKLRVFEMSHKLVIEVYKVTNKFPREELFGLTSQMRRASISAPANIVEGCSRRTTKDYVRFLNLSLGSLEELRYYFELSNELGYMSDKDRERLNDSCRSTIKSLMALITSLSRKK